MLHLCDGSSRVVLLRCCWSSDEELNASAEQCTLLYSDLVVGKMNSLRLLDKNDLPSKLFSKQ